MVQRQIDISKDFLQSIKTKYETVINNTTDESNLYDRLKVKLFNIVGHSTYSIKYSSHNSIKITFDGVDNNNDDDEQGKVKRVK